MRRIVGFVLTLAASIVLAVTPLAGASAGLTSYEEVFRKANEAYRANDFARAARLYKDLVTSGVVSADLYYNLGTTLAQLGQTGEAIAYLEKARRLAPSDPDIRANLEMISPPGNVSQPFVLVVPFLYLRDLLTTEAWLWVATCGFFATMLVWSWLLLFAKGRTTQRWLFLVTGIACVCLVSFAGWSYYAHRTSRYVVARIEAPIYSGPAPTFSRLLTAKEGQKLPAQPYDNAEWKRVVLPTGQTGFVQSEFVEEI